VTSWIRKKGKLRPRHSTEKERSDKLTVVLALLSLVFFIPPTLLQSNAFPSSCLAFTQQLPPDINWHKNVVCRAHRNQTTVFTTTSTTTATLNPPAMSTAYSPVPEMSSATKEILARARQMVPPMLSSFHKGE
jgi:hypothetical protein